MSYCIIMLPFLRANNTSAVHYWALMCVFRRNNKVNIRRRYLLPGASSVGLPNSFGCFLPT